MFKQTTFTSLLLLAVSDQHGRSRKSTLLFVVETLVEVSYLLAPVFLDEIENLFADLFVFGVIDHETHKSDEVKSALEVRDRLPLVVLKDCGLVPGVPLLEKLAFVVSRACSVAATKHLLQRGGLDLRGSNDDDHSVLLELHVGTHGEIVTEKYDTTVLLQDSLPRSSQLNECVNKAHFALIFFYGRLLCCTALVIQSKYNDRNSLV